MHCYSILLLLCLSIASIDGRLHQHVHHGDVNRLKCEMLPYRSMYRQSICYFAIDESMSRDAANANCSRIIAGSKLATEVPSAVWDGLFLQRDQFHSTSSSDAKKAMCYNDFHKKSKKTAAIVKCDEERALVVTTAKGAVNASRPVIFGPLLMENREECETLCRCANDKPKLSCDCGPFSCLLPAALSCSGYAYEATRGSCVLLGQKTEGCENAKKEYTFNALPSIVLLSPSDDVPTSEVTAPSLGDDSDCGKIARDSRVRCTSYGYSCPDRFLPYLVCFIYGQFSFTGGQHISKSSTTWIVSYSTGTWSFSESVAVNITCLPAGRHTYDPCNGNIPRLGNALVLDNSFGCIEGFTWNYAKTTSGNPFNDVPVCKHQGWTNNGGILSDPITEMWCRPNWKSQYPACGQITLGKNVQCTEKGYTCPKGSLPYLACLIDNLWSFTGGKFVYKMANQWKVEYSTGTWSFEERFAFNVSCRPIATHSFPICATSIPRLGNALIVKDAYGCIDGFEWNYAKTREGEPFHHVPQCSSAGWTAGGNLIGTAINEMWCKPLAEQNRETIPPSLHFTHYLVNSTDSRCASIQLDEKVFCRSDGYYCADKYLPYLACLVDSQWSFTGGSRVHKEGSQWIVSYSSGKWKVNEEHAKYITCIYAGTPSKPACAGNVPRYGNAYLAGDTFTCMTGYTWSYAKTVKETAFKGIPTCGADGWTVEGKKLASPITEMLCKPL